MARGGFRPAFGRGRPKGAKDLMKRKKPEVNLPPPDIVLAAINVGLTPLEYMLAVMRDASCDQVRRDRMAMAAAPYCHSRMADNRVGKRDNQQKDSKTAAEEWMEDLDSRTGGRPS